VKVVAEDQGQPQKPATAYLIVHVLPQNFTGIAFVPPIIRVSVPSSKLLDLPDIFVFIHGTHTPVFE